MAKRTKKPTLSKLRKKLWKIFSEYVRRRDNGVCFTCGIQKPWKQMQAGHCFTKKGHPATYYCELNVKTQCFQCNINYGGHAAEFFYRIADLYGQESADDLRRRAKTAKKWTRQEIEDLIEHYQDQLKVLEIF